MPVDELKAWCQAQATDLIAWRRRFHAHPELSFQEQETAAYIRRYLESLGLTWSNPSGHSTVAVIPGNRPGPTVAFRADIDALPIDEQNDVPYRSTRPGVMHACGHDAHTAILMGVARWFRTHGDFPGQVKLIFQEGEELVPGGAQGLVDAGVMDDVDHILGLHVWSDIPIGQAHIVEGPMMAATDRFTVRIRGKGGHGGLPHQTVDALVIASHVVLNLQTIVSRKVDPLESAVVSVGRISAGSAFNVIAEEAILEGTLRSFSNGVREQLKKEVERIAQATCAMYGANCEVELETGYPVLVNHPRETEVFRQACRAALGEDNGIENSRPVPGAEDFARYLEVKPGAFLFLGCRNEQKGAVWPHHHPRFNIDEDVLPLGVEVMVRAGLHLLGA